MYRNMERHWFPVARRPDADDANIVYWYWVEGMVQPLKMDETVIINGGSTPELKQFLKVYTKDDKPSNLLIRTSTEYVSRSDYMFWKDANGTELPYGNTQEQEYTKLGRYSFNKYACTFNSKDTVGNAFRKPPAFQEEYVDFLNCVSGTQIAVTLALLPLCKLIEDCK